MLLFLQATEVLARRRFSTEAGLLLHVVGAKAARQQCRSAQAAAYGFVAKQYARGYCIPASSKYA